MKKRSLARNQPVIHFAVQPVTQLSFSVSLRHRERNNSMRTAKNEPKKKLDVCTRFARRTCTEKITVFIRSFMLVR